MYSGFKPSMEGEPWDKWQDANLIEDFNWGVTVLTMAMRARRTEAEIEARLDELGLKMTDQPKGRKKRRTDW